MESNNSKSIIESLLFALSDPTPLKKLAANAKLMLPETENIVAELAKEYEEHKRGFRILRAGDKIQLVTAPENADNIKQIIKAEMAEGISHAALETLSIILYRGPITRAEIEMVRGVNCSFILRNLLMRGLVEHKKSRSDARRWEYEVSFSFLQHLGITDVKNLPQYEDLHKREEFGRMIATVSALNTENVAVPPEQAENVEPKTEEIDINKFSQ